MAREIHDYQLLIGLLSLVRIITSYGALRSISAAIEAQIEIRALWDRKHREKASDIGLPHISGGGSNRASADGIKFAKFLPVFLMLFWLAVGSTVIVIRLRA